MLETMAPYKFGMTMTSNWVGLATNCMDLSMEQIRNQVAEEA